MICKHRRFLGKGGQARSRTRLVVRLKVVLVHGTSRVQEHETGHRGAIGLGAQAAQRIASLVNEGTTLFIWAPSADYLNSMRCRHSLGLCASLVRDGLLKVPQRFQSLHGVRVHRHLYFQQRRSRPEPLDPVGQGLRAPWKSSREAALSELLGDVDLHERCVVAFRQIEVLHFQFFILHSIICTQDHAEGVDG